MRRKDKAVTDLAAVEAIIRSAAYLTLGLVNAGETYLVPLDFGYESDGRALGSVYFHCARSGLKLDLIKNNPCVSLLFVAEDHALIDEGDGSLACTLNTDYRSVMARGEAQILENKNERLEAIHAILKQHNCEHLPVSPEKLAQTSLVRINIKSATGKAYKAT